jgi:hypothetical protein
MSTDFQNVNECLRRSTHPRLRLVGTGAGVFARFSRIRARTRARFPLRLRAVGEVKLIDPCLLVPVER